jgi:NADPH-dependent curcumin reductase CurA
MLNRQWCIAERPLGRPLKESDFVLQEAEAVSPGDGDVLVRVVCLSFDPAQKGWMENVADYVAPTEIGQVMPAFAVGEVIESRADGFAPGDKVSGRLGWADYVTVPAGELTKLPDDGRLSDHLGVLGISGMTAFFGLQRIGINLAWSFGPMLGGA